MIILEITVGLVVLMGWALWLRHKRWLVTENHQHEVMMAEMATNVQSLDIAVLEAEGAKTLAAARLKRLDTAYGMLPRWSSDKPLGDDRMDRILKVVEEEISA